MGRSDFFFDGYAEIRQKKNQYIQTFLISVLELRDQAHCVPLSILGLRPPYNPPVQNFPGEPQPYEVGVLPYKFCSIFDLKFSTFLKNVKPKSHMANFYMSGKRIDRALICALSRLSTMTWSLRRAVIFF